MFQLVILSIFLFFGRFTTTTTHTTDSTQHPQYTAHMHSLPLPTSVVFLTIDDVLLIAQDFDACLVSILAAMASHPDQSIVVGGLAGMSAANTVLGNGGSVFLLDKFTLDTLKCRAKKPEPRSCAETVVPMWSGCWASSAWIYLLSHVSVVARLSEPTVERSVFLA